MAWLEQVARRGSELRGAASTLTVLVGVGPALWVMRNGGLRGVCRGLKEHEREARQDAIPLLAKGLEVRSTAGDDCIDAFVEALEILDTSRSRLKSRYRAVRQAAWMVAGMFLSLGGMWASYFFAAGYSVLESAFVLLWFAFFLVFLVQGSPVAWHLLQSGMAGMGEKLTSQRVAGDKE